MPIPLILPGQPGANSYQLLEQANAYFSTRLFADGWHATGVDDDRRAQALIGGTNRIDQTLGCDVADAGSLPFALPVPKGIGQATCEMALALLTKTADPAGYDLLSRFQSLGLPGGVRLTMREDGAGAPDALPDVVWRLLGPWLPTPGLTYLERVS